MEAVIEFCEKMNTILDAILHPIRTLKFISYPVCLIGAGIFVLLGILGFKNGYKYAGAAVLIYVLISMMWGGLWNLNL